MLQEAIEARLPLIYAYGSDPINDLSIIQSILSESGLVADEALFESSEIEESTLINTLQEGYCAVVTDAQLGAFNVSAVYEAASDCEIETGGILIILYCSGDDPTSMIKASFFCAGKVLPEERTVKEVLSNYYPGDKLEDALQYYRGLTLNEIVTVAAMSTTLHGDCSFSSVLKTRRTLMGETPGLELVDTAIGFYKPDMSLNNYAVKASKLFHVDLPDFRPRGILLTGLPGTGKTEASKYLASLLEVPLFRLDMGGMMTKWQGESESNLKNALQVAVKSEPCVLLLDEVEKVLGTDSDSGGSVYRMLSQLLWWLQSHQNKILTVMTCNNIGQLPPELYRQGRVDQVIEFKGLTGIDAAAFADEVCTHFEKTTGLILSDDHLVALQHMTEKWTGEDMTLAQSEIIQQVKELFIESNF